MELNDELLRMWKDQADFNRHFTPDGPLEYEDKCAQTKELLLYLTGEIVETLQRIEYKRHRRLELQPNPQAVVEELTDIWKYLLSLMLVWEVTPERFVEEYWRKSMIVRQRFNEEFILDRNQPCAIIDIDNVLCDYTRGFLSWAHACYPELREHTKELMNEMQQDGDMLYLSAASMNMHEQRWQELKHEFRISGAKRHLPVMSGAGKFLRWIKDSGLLVVVLTARPIDQYPNLYGDTLEWLRFNELPHDIIWWSAEKDEKVLSSGLSPLVRFVVDDEERHIRRFARLGARTYWFRPRRSQRLRLDLVQGAVVVESFDDVVRKEQKRKEAEAC